MTPRESGGNFSTNDMATVRKRKWTTAKGETRTAWIVDILDKNGNRERKQFESKQAADDFRIETEGKKRLNDYRASSADLTLKDAAEIYLEYCKGRMQRRECMTRHNLITYEGHLRNYICATEESAANAKHQPRQVMFSKGLGHYKLRELTAGKVADFRDALRTAGVSVPTTRKIIATLKQLLRYAITRDLVTHNVAKEISVIGRRDERSKKIVPPSKEAMRLLLSAADPDFRVQLLFAALTGVRAGELHALRWKHIDLENAEVRIEVRVDAYGEEDTTKTEAGIRSVPLSETVVDVLTAWKARTLWWMPDDLVFPSHSGTHLDHNNMIRNRFAPIFDRLDKLHARDPGKHPKAPAYFNWHALRHFAISCWIEAGLAPKTVQTFAGHSSLAVTMDRYGHLFKSDDHKSAMDAIARNVEGAPNKPETPIKRLEKPKDYIP